VFVIVRWQGSGASYFRSAQVDRTRRARPASVLTDGNPNKHNTSSGPSARVRWDIRDGASVFNNDACYLHPAPKEDFGFDSIGVDDVDDGCVRPSRDEAPSSSISSPPVNHLPWEVRFAVCVSRPGSIYGTTERVLGEGVLNLAEFTDSVHGKRVSEKRVEVQLAKGGNGGNDSGNDPSSAASSARLSVSVSVTRAPGLASKAAARLGDKGLRAKDRAVAGKLFSYLSGSPSGANKSTTNRSSGDSLPARSSEDSNESDNDFSDEMDTCESDSMPSPPMTPTRGRTEARTVVSGSTEDPNDSFPAEDSPGFNGNQKRHSRSWSWSMKWTSPVRRRRLDGVGEPMEVVLDDELLQTPPPRPRAPSRTKKSSEETEDLTDEALSSAEDPAETRPKHRRTSSWTRVFGAPRRSKSPETLEAERVAKETKKAAKAEEKAAEKLAKEEKKRAKRELIARAKDEEKMFRQVLEETRQAALESLPRRRSKSDAHAACVLVTPATAAMPKIGEEGERFRAGSCSGGSSRNLAAALDEAARDESADGEVTGSIPGEDEFDEESAKSAARADHGEWLHVELRGQPSRHSTSIDEPCPDADSIGVPPVKIPAMAFFASLDQMTARGPGACTLSCVALAEWLEDHPGRLPTAPLVSTVGEASSADSELEGSNPTVDESSHGRGGSVRGALAFTPGDEVTHEASLDAHRRPKLVFDSVIDGAASEWRTLCEDRDLVARFPDKHFDLETALGLHVPFPVPNAEGRMSDDKEEDEDKADDSGSRELGEEKKSKVRVDHGESFVGFLTPPGVSPGDSPNLDALTAAAPPLPEIITALASTAPATYVVSWLDHFFVLKFATERKSAEPPGSNDSASDSDDVEGEMETVVYVMDSLGERLCEGCKRGYLLRFDGASDEAGAAAAASRFVSEVLPSRLLRQCGVDIASFAAGTKGAVEPTPEYLMRRLQIEFHRVRRR
jgi:hypothetical protein